MSEPENIITRRTVTSLSLVTAIRSAPATRSGLLRKPRRVDDLALAEHILAAHEEAEPEGLNEPEPSGVIAEANATITDLRGMVAERDATIDSQAAIIEGLQDGNADLRAERDEKASLIAQGDREITRLRSDVAVKDTKLAEARRKVVDLRKQADRAAKIRDQDAAGITAQTERAEAAEAKLAEAEASAAELMPAGMVTASRESSDAMRAALERFAAPGAMTAGERRKAASDALSAVQGHAEVAGVAR